MAITIIILGITIIMGTTIMVTTMAMTVRSTMVLAIRDKGACTFTMMQAVPVC